MSKPQKEPIGFVETMQKLRRSGLENASAVNTKVDLSISEIETLDSRIQTLFRVVNNQNRRANQVIFFVMYDIENNKVRNLVSKYLLKKGCTRVQRSIFLADLDRSVFEQIKSDLIEVQACYENPDSILVVPLSTDYLQAMTVIGQSIYVDLITKEKSVVFF